MEDWRSAEDALVADTPLTRKQARALRRSLAADRDERAAKLERDVRAAGLERLASLDPAMAERFAIPPDSPPIEVMPRDR